MASTFSINLAINRTCLFEGELFEADGSTPYVLESNDKLRFKVYRGDNATPVLDLLSGSPLSGGSGIVIDSLGSGTEGAKYTMTFAQTDIESSDVKRGPYDAELIVVDDSAGASPELRNKFVQFGVVHFLYTGGGNLGP